MLKISDFCSSQHLRFSFIRKADTKLTEASDLAKLWIDKVEKILKGSLDSIQSLSPSVKIQIIGAKVSPSLKIQITGGKVCLRCKSKTLLGKNKKKC